jgi:hypothetical protein
MSHARSGLARVVFDNSLLLLLATAAAVVWANLDLDSYDAVAHPLHFWVNDIGMVFFFAALFCDSRFFGWNRARRDKDGSSPQLRRCAIGSTRVARSPSSRRRVPAGYRVAYKCTPRMMLQIDQACEAVNEYGETFTTA